MNREFRLLTLNAHSHAESDYERKLHQFVHGVVELEPDIIALQEVSQTISSQPIQIKDRYTPAAEDIVIGENNHAYRAAVQLAEQGLHYYWTWLPIKQAYGDLIEGIALLSRLPIKAIRHGCISKTNDSSNWRRRMILGIQTTDTDDTWYFCTHMARWDDPQDDFLSQWEKTKATLPDADTLWLMGDFNNPAERRNEGYDLMSASGWQDSFLLAQKKDCGITVPQSIDGWRDTDTASMRIDQIWCNRRAEVWQSTVVFNGRNLPIVSDHFGVMATILRNESEVLI